MWLCPSPSLQAEYANVYGIGKKLVTWVMKHKTKATFVHTDTIDSYIESWQIIEKASRAWNIDTFINREQLNGGKQRIAPQRTPAEQSQVIKSLE